MKMTCNCRINVIVKGIKNSSNKKAVSKQCTMKFRIHFCSKKGCQFWGNVDSVSSALTLSKAVLIQLHSINLIRTLACDVQALASGDPNSPAHTHFNLNPCQQPSLLQSDKLTASLSLTISAEQSLEEIKKLLLLLLGCAVQVNAEYATIYGQKTWNA